MFIELCAFQVNSKDVFALAVIKDKDNVVRIRYWRWESRDNMPTSWFKQPMG